MYTIILQNQQLVKSRKGFIHKLNNKIMYRQVESIEQASKAIRDFIKAYDLGASCFTGGTLLDANNKIIGRISYNGRYWPN